MKAYYDSFVELSLEQCVKGDYLDKSKVKRHNAAAKKLKKLQREMAENDCEDILSMLLIHKDNRVRINAASLCLQINVLVQKAVLTLSNIVNTSDDSTICFSAKMLLQGYTGYKTD